MKERPILFKPELVTKILKGEKTQTRRVVLPTMSKPKVAPLYMEPLIIDGEREIDKQSRPCWIGRHFQYPTQEKWFSCPYGKAGDRLWVREAWAKVPRTAYSQSPDVWQALNPDNDHDAAVYKAGWIRSEPSWKPSIHMPKWACRLRLKIKSIRVERIQAISAADCQAEGISVYQGDELIPAGTNKLTDAIYIDQFIKLWESVNGSRGFGWDVNPWCWVVEFSPVVTTSININIEQVKKLT